MTAVIRSEDGNQRIELFGIPFDNMTREEMVSQVDAAITCNVSIWLTFINVSILVEASRDADLRFLIKEADYRLCDGMGIMYASRMLGRPLAEMVSGPFLLFQLLRHAEEHNYSVYLLGHKKDVIHKAAVNIRRDYPSLEVVGYRDGFFSANEEGQVVEDIKNSRAQLLFVGMGFPRERLFIKRNRSDLKVPVCMDVGGAFTVLAGIHNLAPQWMRAAGMEWVYRMAQEPGRLWKRYLFTNLVFASLLIKEMYKRRNAK
jgi:N-acetylglucosaminyldiphosphoundecaprenol N-acetyl-beta-D-mannosaminyltransferase